MSLSRERKIHTRFFHLWSRDGLGFCRLFGVGIGWKDTRRWNLSFSERNGYKRHFMIGRWSLGWIGSKR